MSINELCTLLAKVVNEEPAAISPETILASLPAWDSLGVVMWIAEIDETFGVTLQAKQITECRTTRDLAALLGDRILG
jgi:acyl carrier protein